MSKSELVGTPIFYVEGNAPELSMNRDLPFDGSVSDLKAMVEGLGWTLSGIAVPSASHQFPFKDPFLFPSIARPPRVRDGTAIVVRIRRDGEQPRAKLL